jgi:hypothetical protein
MGGFGEVPGETGTCNGPGFNLAAPKLRSGTVLCGRYEVRELIGRGGMGVVHAAHDRQRNQEIAIKVLAADLFANPDAQAQFRREAQITSNLNHPSVVNVYDLHVDGDLAFLTMELLRGKTLRQEMRERKAAGRSFSIEEAKRIVLELCDALKYAHHFTVHRDVKPENIWIDAEGHLKLMDFGLAGLLLDHERSRSGISNAGLSMGTPYYMAPEQLKEGSSTDARADQYSAAALFYELLTGTVVAGMIGSLRKTRRDFPHGLSKVIHRALSVAPEDRYKDIAAFALAITTGGDPIRWLPKNRLQVTVALLLIASVSFGLFGVMNRAVSVWRDAQHKRQTAEQETETLSKIVRGKVRGLENGFRQYHRQVLSENRPAIELSDPLGLGEIKSDLERSDGLLKAAESSRALQYVLGARDQVHEAERKLRSLVSARDAEGTVQQYIEFLGGFSTNLGNVAPGEMHVWTRELNRSREALRGRNIVESGMVLSNLHVNLTEKIRSVALTLRAGTEADRHAWESQFEANAIPKMEFLAPSGKRLGDADQFFAAGNYLEAARVALEIGTKYRGWVTELEALHSRSDAFLEELPGPLEIRTNDLGMRFVRVDENLWVSIWETRMMDYAVFLRGLPHRENKNPDLDWWKNLEFVPSPTQPAIGISEADAEQFTGWLTNIETKSGTLNRGESYVLISDAIFEELVQRLSSEVGGVNSSPSDYSKGVYPWGVTWPVRKGIGSYWGDPGYRIERFVRPVASAACNRLGIFDFDGNVWERMDSKYDFGPGLERHSDRYFPQFCGGGQIGVGGGNIYRKIKPGYVWVGTTEAIGFRVVIRRGG